MQDVLHIPRHFKCFPLSTGYGEIGIQAFCVSGCLQGMCMFCLRIGSKVKLYNRQIRNLEEAPMHAQVNPLIESRQDAANDEGARESTRPIRALNRGLEVLTELNRLERAAINTLANAVGLPRTTTYRILET